MTPADDLRFGAAPGPFETSSFNEDTEMDPTRWGEVLSEKPINYEVEAIRAEIDQIEAYANDPAVHAAEVADRSYEAQVAARSAERLETAQREQLVDYASHIGATLVDFRVREVPGQNREEWTLAA